MTEHSEYKYGNVIVSNGTSGYWSVSDVEVTKFDAMMSQIKGGGIYSVEQGTYKRLTRGRTVVMSNTQMELRTNRQFVRAAEGNCPHQRFRVGNGASSRPDEASS